MNNIGKPERVTQNRIIGLFQEELGYTYLGDWTDREDNSNIEEALLKKHLKQKGYSDVQIQQAVYKLQTEAKQPNKTLYAKNKEVYNILRYGHPVQSKIGQPKETIQFIDWKNPSQNEFAIAEEVTLYGNHERRPDIVLYINGIAIAILELKNSRVSLAGGIRQNISNQRHAFNEGFFSTIQFIFAGNDTEGLKYGTIGTPEKYFLKWKEDEEKNVRFKLDKYLIKICSKERFLELIYDFIIFDAGIKKVPRVNQYFGVKATQKRIQNREGGIVWHTQGSGKSITMVFLAKWILENNPHGRVAIITDRDELDRQIKSVFSNVGEEISRAKSSKDLLHQLGQAKPRLLCSLIHKFGRRDIEDLDMYMKVLKGEPAHTHGDVFVFVDECHRTQSGKLHKLMKAIMPHAIFIGFTGTPLLKKDKATSREVFGQYVHTYKYIEAIQDKVVLDLIYEARDIDQNLNSEEHIDTWFDAKTKPLNDWQKDELKTKWGTMKKVLSSKSRMHKVINDIILDFNTRPRLSHQRGTALLVASSVYEACKYFKLFQQTEFKDKVGIVTSYNPNTQDITREDSGINSETDKQFIYNIYKEILQNVTSQSQKSKTEIYEEKVKTMFISEPANMKLIIVVNKLLTGFDAPSCTYLYIDKNMQDHSLFQAICRTNRLDGEDKDFGYIIDYKDLLKNIMNERGTGVLQVYSSELDDSEGSDIDVLMQDRLKKGKERLDLALQAIESICEPVRGQGELEHIRHFCGNTEIEADLQDKEPLRFKLYKATAMLVRSYANISGEMEAADYTANEAISIKNQVRHYIQLRETIKKASGETIDLKAYEADMRHLIDNYIESSQARTGSHLDNTPLLDLIVTSGVDKAINAFPSSLKNNQEAIIETITNNIRKKIITERANNPEFYDRMSQILDEIIKDRKSKAFRYEAFLKNIAQLAKKIQKGYEGNLPQELDTYGKKALYENLNKDLKLTLKIHEAVKTNAPDGWKGHQAKEQIVKRAIYDIVLDRDEVEKIFQIIYEQEEY